MEPPHEKTKGPVVWQPRFGIRGIFLVTLVVCVMAAGGYYLGQALRGGRPFQLVFILFTLASPLLVLVLVSVVRALLQRTRRRR